MKVKNISMSCTHEGVNIDFNYYEGNKEINVNHRASGKGYTTSRNDRYDLEGNRLTQVEDYFSPFTQAYFEEVDARARAFAANLEGTEIQTQTSVK